MVQLVHYSVKSRKVERVERERDMVILIDLDKVSDWREYPSETSVKDSSRLDISLKQNDL